MPKKELHLYELFLLFKFTNVQATVQDKINFYRTLIKENGSQLMIKNNGKIISMVPDLYSAWHAGISEWKKNKRKILLFQSSIDQNIKQYYAH